MRLDNALTAEREREQESEAARERVRAERERHAFTRAGTDLMRTVGACVREVARGAKRGRSPVRLSESESDALAATVALAVLESHARQHPGEPLTVASYGRSYVLALTRGAIRERSYRDTLDGWRTRAEVERADSPTVAGSVDSLPAESESESESERPAGGWLAHALERESERTGEPLAPVAADLPALTGAVARAIRSDLALTPREAGSVYVALTVAAGTTLATLAVEPGTPSLRTLATRSAEGAAVLRERVPASDLRRYVREAARELVADYRLRVALSGRAEVGEAARCALAAIDYVASGERVRAGYRQSVPRVPARCVRVRLAAGKVARQDSRRHPREYGPLTLPALPREPQGSRYGGPLCPCCKRGGQYIAHPSYPQGLHPSHPARHPDDLMAGMAVYSLTRPAATYGPRTCG